MYQKDGMISLLDRFNLFFGDVVPVQAKLQSAAMNKAADPGRAIQDDGTNILNEQTIHFHRQQNKEPPILIQKDHYIMSVCVQKSFGYKPLVPCYRQYFDLCQGLSLLY